MTELRNLHQIPTRQSAIRIGFHGNSINWLQKLIVLVGQGSVELFITTTSQIAVPKALGHTIL